MLKRLAITCLTLLCASSLLAQDATDLERRLRELEQKVAQMQAAQPNMDLAEVKRQIEVLAAEVENLKTRQSDNKAVVADTQTFGLGAAASKVYRAAPGVSIGGYGEMLYQNYDSPLQASSADLLRGVIYAGYKFNDRTLFNSELEVEHGSTEHGGEVSMEFAYLDYLVRPEANIRAGLVLVPMGLINEQHEPTAYFGARRPQTERLVIPSTWADLGAGVFGDAGKFSYRGYVLTGLNSEEFNGEDGIREGRQGGAEAIADDWAVVGRVDFHPFEGTMIGGSLYSGNSGQTAPFAARVNIGEVHADAKFRGTSLRALFARGSLSDAARVNEENGLTGSDSVGKSFGGWYVEGGYDLATLRPNATWSLSPYARYERVDTQRRVPTGFVRNLSNDQKIFTVGFAFKPVSQTVLKLDWQNVDNAANTGINQWNIALGYIF